MNICLSELGSGQTGRIVSMNITGDIRRRLSDMGLVSGSEVVLERVAPLGDPIEIRVKGYSLSLRKEIASEIEVQPLDVPLIGILAGRSVTVSSITGGTRLKRRLSDMGLIPGTPLLIVENHFPGPLLISVRGSQYVLGQGMAEQVLVKES